MTLSQMEFPNENLGRIDVVIRGNREWYALSNLARRLNLHRNFGWLTKQISKENLATMPWKVVSGTAESTMDVTFTNRAGVDEVFSAARNRTSRKLLTEVANFLNTSVFPPVSAVTGQAIPEIVIVHRESETKSDDDKEDDLMSLNLMNRCDIATANTADHTDIFSFLNSRMGESPEILAETEDGTVETRTFAFEGSDVRTVMKAGEPWFVGKDVAEILAYKNPQEAIRTHVDDDDKGVSEILTPGGKQKTPIINESGVYSLILRSKLPSAKRFKKWITQEVLPSLRRNGAYLTPQKLYETMSDPRAIAAMFNTLADEQEKRKTLEAEIKTAQPKLALAQRVLDSDENRSLVSVGNLAKLVSTPEHPIGRVMMFKWLREKKYIQKDSTEPYQKWINEGIFTVRLKTKLQGGTIQTFPVPLLTPKGVEKIVAQYDLETA